MWPKLKIKICWWAAFFAYGLLLFFNFPIPRDLGSLMSLFIDFDVWLLTRDISPTSAGVFLGLLIGTIIVPEVWRYFVEQIAPFDPKAPDTDADKVIDYIVNDSRQPVEPSLKIFEDGQVVQNIGSEHMDANRLLNEAAADGRVKLWGRRGMDPLSSAHRYEKQYRIIPQEYWINAEIDWWNSLDPNWPQTKPSHGDPANVFIPYRSLRLNNRQVKRVWSSKWFHRRLWDIIKRRKRIVYPPENRADLYGPLPHELPKDD